MFQRDGSFNLFSFGSGLIKIFLLYGFSQGNWECFNDLNGIHGSFIMEMFCISQRFLLGMFLKMSLFSGYFSMLLWECLEVNIRH